MHDKKDGIRVQRVEFCSRKFSSIYGELERLYSSYTSSSKLSQKLLKTEKGQIQLIKNLPKNVWVAARLCISY